ncbi:hypothetical protein [Saccharomonospora xinjiangensis]|uniref:hypothetical protein n=1 Tax=Saccharomonospora xinjiangensis TaxID=75294 RepID=UPI0038CD1C36
MDSAEADADLDVEYLWGELPEQAPVPLPAGRWRVQAVHTAADEDNWVGLVRLLPADDARKKHVPGEPGLCLRWTTCAAAVRAEVRASGPVAASRRRAARRSVPGAAPPC